MLAKTKDEKKADVYLECKSECLRWNILEIIPKRTKTNTFLLRFWHAILDYPIKNSNALLDKMCAKK